MKSKTSYIKLLVLAGLIASISACAPGGAGMPTRKKMPELNSYTDDFEGPMPFEKNTTHYTAADFAFATGSAQLMLNGVSQNFITVSLPDEANDSLALNLLKSIKPFALPLISSWAHSQQRGVAIDLSAHNGAAIHRSDFVLKRAGDFTIPVVVIWDAAAAPRLATLRSLADDLPAIQFNQVQGSAPANF